MTRAHKKNRKAAVETVEINTGGWAYRGYLWAIAIVPMLGLVVDFSQKSFNVVFTSPNSSISKTLLEVFQVEFE